MELELVELCRLEAAHSSQELEKSARYSFERCSGQYLSAVSALECRELVGM